MPVLRVSHGMSQLEDHSLFRPGLGTLHPPPSQGSLFGMGQGL